MTLIEALKTDKSIRHPKRIFSYFDTVLGVKVLVHGLEFVDADWLLSKVRLTKEDILSEEWEVQKMKKETFKCDMCSYVLPISDWKPTACQSHADTCYACNGIHDAGECDTD